eukprot:Gregarina_sp_Pseudo_9__964@NODE_1618_length_1450_cov_24_361446_g1500_i0_p2_GENE_NODE_1618_length_1450_cov_24_361446_g1500_i0NODE_1618_length_1450_cov_24_361446_g1500_i0_p2_ORF_typecomplete_len155_score10_49Rab5ip/PF07019_12/2_8e12BTP/PF05232_12/1_5e03BTP/PF05232_12/0_21_NODE_1618_length_1450_cov_24_361446_g1500_i063467
MNSHLAPQSKRAILANTSQVATVRNVSAILSGAVAGILGCESWLGGAIFFLIASVLVTPTVYTCTLHLMTLAHDRSLQQLGTQLSPKSSLLDLASTIRRYYPSLHYVYQAQLTTGILSFVLTWTLLYNLVYVFH